MLRWLWERVHTPDVVAGGRAPAWRWATRIAFYRGGGIEMTSYLTGWGP